MHAIYKSLTKIFAAAFLVVLAMSIIRIRGTNSSFTDTEKSLGNSFTAGNLNIGIDDPVNFSSAVAPTDKSKADFKIVKNTSLDIQYIISFKNFDGTLCDHLNLKAFQGNETTPSFDHELNKFGFISNDAESLNWKFEVSLDSNDSALQNKECKFDIEAKAWQKNEIIYTDGFSDIETAKAKITSGTWYTGPDVVINEIMWMGSNTSIGDEWLELKNMTGKNIDISGWELTKLKSGNETLMVTIPNGSHIEAHKFYLISEYDKDHSAINIIPDLVIGSGSTDGDDFVLANDKLQIKLYKSDWTVSGNLVDTADDGAGNPFAGNNGTQKQSMERKDPPGDGTKADSWKTCTVSECNSDTYWDTPAGNNYGTPGAENK